MKYLTEKDGKFYLNNKILMWIGRGLALIHILFIIILLFFAICIFVMDDRISGPILLLIALCLLFLFSFLLIGSKVTVISKEGIDTYYDMLFFKFRKHHLNPGLYELGTDNRWLDNDIFTSIYIKIGGVQRTIYTYCSDNKQSIFKEVDDALMHFPSFTKMGFMDLGYIRCPKCNRYIAKSVGKCLGCGYSIETARSSDVTVNGNATQDSDNDFPLIMYIGKTVGKWNSIKLSKCEYDQAVNNIYCFRNVIKHKATVYLHTNGIRIECGIMPLVISFGQIRRMSFVPNMQQKTEYQYNLKIEYFDVYEHKERTIFIACKDADNNFLERYETERNANNIPSRTGSITCNLMDGNGKYSREKAAEAFGIIGVVQMMMELKHIQKVGNSEIKILSEYKR